MNLLNLKLIIFISFVSALNGFLTNKLRYGKRMRIPINNFKLYCSAKNDDNPNISNNNESNMSENDIPDATNKSIIEEDKSKEESDKKKSNVDLFAAGEITPKLDSDTRSSISRTISNNAKTLAGRGSTVGSSSASASSSLDSLDNVVQKGNLKTSSLMELQAELLRLEAERDQIIVDRQRIEETKARLVDIDNLIVQLLGALRDEETASTTGVGTSPLQPNSLPGLTNSRQVLDKTSLEEILSKNRKLLGKELFFRLAELANVAVEAEEKKKFLNLCDDVMEAIMETDTNLHATITSDIQKELDMELNKLKDGNKSKELEGAQLYDKMLKQWVEQTMSAGNDTNVSIPNGSPGIGIEFGRSPFGANGTSMPDMGRTMIRFPAALPLNMLPMMLKSPEIRSEDLESLKTEVFSPDVLNNTLVDYSTLLVTFRGTPTDSPRAAFEEANKRINERPELRDRVRLFMLPEYRLAVQNQPQGLNINPAGPTMTPPKAPDGVDRTVLEKYSGAKFEPIFTILSKDAIPRATDSVGYAFMAATAVATAITTAIYATDVNSLNADFLQRALGGDVEVADRLALIVGGVLGLQIVHDFGHWIAALAHGCELEFPFVLPSLQIGCFGSVTRFRSYAKDRKELFDVSIAGPLAGLTVSMAVFVYGLMLTQAAIGGDASTFPALPVGFFQTSFLLYEITNSFLPQLDALTATDITSVLPVHPLVCIGASGLITNALNFMPIGRLDGGRVAMAVAGRQSAGGISTALLIGQAISFLAQPNPVMLFWTIFVVLLQRGPDLPPIDDVTPIATDDDDKNKGIKWFARAGSLIACSLMSGLMILPAPQELSSLNTAATQSSQITTDIQTRSQERASPAQAPLNFNKLKLPSSNNNGDGSGSGEPRVRTRAPVPPPGAGPYI